MSSNGSESLLTVDGLLVEFSRGRFRTPLRAVDTVSFQVGARETVGLVGETGSGKTTIGRSILGLVQAQAGRITFNGEDITNVSFKRRRALSAELQAIFQNPYGSLNPTRTVGQTLAETFRVHSRAGRDETRERVEFMLQRVGLPANAASRYPAHFSGGQRQRIAIARALMLSPRLVICDEPTSALDLSVQANVLNLLRDLQQELGASYLFISHDLAIVRHLSHRLLVLYRGQIVECGEANDLYRNPRHPYTRILFAAAPVPNVREQRRRREAIRFRSNADALQTIESHMCPLVGRCPHAITICSEARPLLEPTDNATFVACHRWRDLPAESGLATRLTTAE